jgi:hypothetical protein
LDNLNAVGSFGDFQQIFEPPNMPLKFKLELFRLFNL